MDNTSDDSEVGETEEPRERRVYDLAIFDMTTNGIVAEKLAHSVFQLPSTEIPAHLIGEGDHVVEKSVEELFGVSVYIEKAIFDEFNRIHDWPAADHLRWLVYVDTCGEIPQIEQPLEWVDSQIACKATWIRKNWNEEGDALRKEIERMFGELNRVCTVEDDRSWVRVGWRGRVTAWAQKVLRERNLTMLGKFRTHVETENSTTMKSLISKAGDENFQKLNGRMAKGDEKRRKLNEDKDEHSDQREDSDFLFVKGYERSLREGERTAAVGRVVGKIVPEVLGVNKSEGAMLQRDAGMLTDDSFDEKALMETIFTMQKRSVDRVEELEAAGVMVADSRWVGANVETILGHELLDDWCDESLKNGNKDAKKQVEKLRSCTPKFKGMCRKISEYDLPSVVVHGDLRLHNVGRRSKGEEGLYHIFDWETCFIGNPLHDFATVLAPLGYGEIPGYVMNEAAGRKEVCRRWLLSVSDEEMKKLFEMIGWIERLICIYQFSEQYSHYDRSMMEARMLVIEKVDPFLDSYHVPNIEL